MVENKTPETVPQNPSNIYAISMKVRNVKAKVSDESFKARIVIDGKSYDMVRADKTLFTFDYKTDDLKHRAAYYFDVNYVLCGVQKTYTSRIYRLGIVNRYAVGFECNRGRPYTQISLLGRGFAEEDTVEIGEILCDTEFISPNVLTFTVPFAEEGKHYWSVLRSGNGDIGLGDFFIDGLKIGVEPESILLETGGKQVMAIFIEVDAPEFGLPLDITTDIPESIIMHDVTIRGGKRSANVVITGGKPGAGSLFVGAPGFEECRISVLVHGNGPEEDDGENFQLDDGSDWADDFTPVD
jgi:hypothetical protein